jgi:hypothetical protein
MSNSNQISSLLNAPKWKFKEPKRIPPKLELNSFTLNTNKSFKEKEKQKQMQTQETNIERSSCCCINNCSFSTNSESEEEYQNKSNNIFNFIVKRK